MSADFKCRFLSGKIYFTDNVSEKMCRDKSFSNFVNDSLCRFVKCDWGDIDEKDSKLNAEAIENGNVIIKGAYKQGNSGIRIKIVTGCERCGTTVMFYDEY